MKCSAILYTLPKQLNLVPWSSRLTAHFSGNYSAQLTSFSTLVNSHFHDDIILLLRLESFRVLLSCSNWGLCYLNLAVISKFKYEKKNEKGSGLSSKMTPSCKWPIWSTVAGNDELRVGF